MCDGCFIDYIILSTPVGSVLVRETVNTVMSVTQLVIISLKLSLTVQPMSVEEHNPEETMVHLILSRGLLNPPRLFMYCLHVLTFFTSTLPS